MWEFERGRTHNRRADIHARFGEQQQGRIITPADYPLVVRFVIVLCRNCHRRVHFGQDGSSYSNDLLARMPTIEPPYLAVLTSV